MVVLVNGCSFSRGPGSWPYALQAIYNFDLINLAQAGAGDTYIFESTVAELSCRNYDLVLIMWSGPNRIDYRVDTKFTSPYTSEYQSIKNDWPEKIINPINDQDYVQKDWVFGCGYLNFDKGVKELFSPYYKHTSYNQMVDSFLIRVISLQDILKQKNIPYIFSFYYDYIDNIKKINPNLCKLIDWDNCCIQNNINTIMQKNSWFDTDGLHPATQAHRVWAQELKNHITKKNIDMCI
jgi:hypothetical protein